MVVSSGAVMVVVSLSVLSDFSQKTTGMISPPYSPLELRNVSLSRKELTLNMIGQPSSYWYKPTSFSSLN